MKIFKYLSVFLKSITHKKISYSYGGIDAIVENIFKDKKKGIYVDIFSFFEQRLQRLNFNFI